MRNSSMWSSFVIMRCDILTFMWVLVFFCGLFLDIRISDNSLISKFLILFNLFITVSVLNLLVIL